MREEISRRKRRTKKQQRRFNLPTIDRLAAALYWIVKLVLMLIDWFTR